MIVVDAGQETETSSFIPENYLQPILIFGENLHKSNKFWKTINFLFNDQQNLFSELKRK